MLFYKKVDAIQFKLNDEQKEAIKNKKAIFFEGSPVRHIGGDQYLAVLQQGENLIKIFEGQWLIRHPDGLCQILWPDQFAANFKAGDSTETVTGFDPFKTKSYNQPNIML